MSNKRKVHLRLFLIALAVGFTAFLVISWYVGGQLAAATPCFIPPPPDSLAAQVVQVDSESGSSLRGWLCVPQKPVAAVVLLHGVRSTRWQMVPRARELVSRGFAVLLVDLQAHGESPGTKITFGHLESRDAISVVEFARARLPSLKIGGIGVSLGGAAFALAGDRMRADALVLESVYPDIAQAIDNRIAMRLGVLSKVLTPVLLLQLRPRLGVSPSQLRPIEGIAKLECPVLVASGSEDRHTTRAETQRLYEAAGNPKQLWLVDGASHVDLYDYDPDAYRNNVIRFLEEYLLKPKTEPDDDEFESCSSQVR